ncbi:hypothetical protein Si037_01640 [Streptococcus infantarius subsp. infantarius]|nr:hypothetical protein [Streptococcus infantarius subsp. infantarius]
MINILTRKRNSNIELLRIISMLLIVSHHFSVHGDFDSLDSITMFNKVWLQFIQLGGKIGVNIFVIISGYFLIQSSKNKLSKVLKLWVQLLFYSFIIYLIFVIVGDATISIKELIKNIFPVIFTKWWFASTYFILYLLTPYLNKLLTSFSKNEYQNFLMLLTFLWCIIPTFTTNLFQSNPLIWFVYLYALAGYIRLYGLFDNIKAKTCILIAIVIYILTFLSAVIFDILGLKVNFFLEHATYFFEMQKLPILIISILLFLGFLKIDIGSNRVINIVASATFGVYLIHDNNYVRVFLWENLFKNASFARSDYLILYSILVIILVYIVCTLIELMRIYLIEKRYMPWLTRISEKLENKLKKLQDSICRLM